MDVPAGGDASRIPDLSVVLASAGDREAVGAALASLRDTCEGICTEFIVVSAGAAELSSIPGAELLPGGIRIEHRPPGTLTPVLWGVGARIARGRLIGFTTDQLRVGRPWAGSLLEAIHAGAVGAGGPINVTPGAAPAVLATHLVRFSGFSPAAWPTRTRAADIPGDNAIYRRDALIRHGDLLEEGLWEFEFHRRFERSGEFLEMIPGALATMTTPQPFGSMLRQRYRHAKRFSASRVHRHGVSRLRLLFAAPVVPLVLLARIGRRAAAEGAAGRFVVAFPWLTLLTAVWALGEASGAIARDPDPA